jgi:hypothetical protein
MPLARLEKGGVRQSAVTKRRAKRLHQPHGDKREPPHEMIRFAFPLPRQFIRASRNVVRHKIPWHKAYPLFKQRLDSYL